MDHFSQVSSRNRTIMTQQIHARFTLSIIMFIKVSSAEEIVQHCTEHCLLNVVAVVRS